MSDFNKYLIQRILSNDNCKDNRLLFQCEIREVMHGILLPELAKTDFFSNNAFQGGTALRIFYGLKRYSDDFDFTMIENKIESFHGTNI